MCSFGGAARRRAKALEIYTEFITLEVHARLDKRKDTKQCNVQRKFRIQLVGNFKQVAFKPSPLHLETSTSS
jgi:hypothetical protein